MPPRPLSFRTSLRLASLSLATALALGGAACHSGPPRGPGGGREAVHIPVMAASGKFFDGRLSADIRFGRARLPSRLDGPESRRGKNDPRANARGPRGGGLSADTGMGTMGMGMNVDPGGSRGGPREEFSGPSPAGARARAEQNPAVQLHLTLTNNGVESLEIDVLEFSSVLGNFAVHPAKTAIAAGATATFEPMTSRLGIPQGDLPLKIRLRSGGQTEEQTLTLELIAEDGPAP